MVQIRDTGLILWEKKGGTMIVRPWPTGLSLLHASENCQETLV